jgi:HSP20 family molecular chaperone IbpA
MTTNELAARDKQELTGLEQVRPGKHYVPQVDIYEDADGLRFWAEMPGVDPQAVTVELEDDVLTLRGEVSLKDYEELSPVYTEYNVGHFLRRFTVPDGGRFDQERISARLVDGVLEVALPRAEKSKPRRIAVEFAS